MEYPGISTSDMNFVNTTMNRLLDRALEQSMKIEAMEGYPGSLRVARPPTDANLGQLQGKISTLTENIQELMIPRTR
jgi:hypothetical protein